MGRVRAPVAAGLAALAVACVLLPWWRADGTPVLLVDGPVQPLAPDAWTGAELLGAPLAIGLGMAAAVAVAVAVAPALATAVATSHPLGALRTPSAGCEVIVGVRSAAVSGLVGVAAAACGGRVLATWGPGVTPGAWAAVVLGVAAVVVAASRTAAGTAGRQAAAGTTDRQAAMGAASWQAVGGVGRSAAAGGDGHTTAASAAKRAVAVGVAAIAVVGLVIGVRPVDTAAANGPYVRLADLAEAGALRSGATALPSPDLRLTLVDGAVAAVTADGVATVDHGRVDVLARVPADDRVRHAGGILGVAGDRVARFVAPGTLLVSGLRPGDPTAVHVRGVADASAVGPDGTLWLRGYGEPAAAVRRLDLHAYDGAIALDVSVLPVVTVDAPVGAAPLAAADLLPVPDGALRRTPSRLERVTAAPGRTVVTPLAGGLDPACGLTAVARSAALGAPGPFWPTPDGGAWLTANGRLLRVDPDGVLRAVRAPLPGPASALVTTPDGGLVVATRQALWALPPNVALEELPPTRSDCVPDPPPVGPPVGLVPITNTGTDRLGVPLGVDGRWASGSRDGQISAVSADGRTRVPLGVRQDARPGPVWPDGAGGVWWLEGATPVHARPARPETRLPPLPLPASPMSVVPDLGDRPPLVATPDGAYRLDGTQVVDGPVTGGVVRADGRGWVLAGGRVLALDHGRVLGPVIDGGGPVAPVAVQLAKGVPPAHLVLGDASLGLDAQGRAAVLADGVVLAISADGAVRPVAQDPRLTALTTVEGGLVQRGDNGALLRVDLPG